jgi:8-oxo-dGTP diphosphatase
MKRHIKVVAAVIKHDGQFLAVQRAKSQFQYISYKWEFPGGKVEQGETLTDAIKREIHEELKILGLEFNHLLTSNYEYPDFHITIHSYVCELGSQQFTLTEHIDFRFLHKEELWDVDWAAADKPIVEAILKDSSN